jgi:hypothetical protein
MTHDRGDKIVQLAREMLRTDAPLALAGVPSGSPAISFRMLCFASVLAALGGSFVTSMAAETHRPLNRYERVELDALVYYAAHQKNLDETVLRRDVQRNFGVSSFDDLTENNFQTARRYLQDLIR